MLHHTASSVPGTALFHTWHEARWLWERLVCAAPEAAAIVLLPDRYHLLHPGDLGRALDGARSGYARWRNRRRLESGPVWRAATPPSPVPSEAIDARVIDLHALPSRTGLVDDPLGWAWSTLRDACGLAGQPARPSLVCSGLHHARVCARAAVRGAPLPGPSTRASLDEVTAAVSAAMRVPRSEVGQRGPSRGPFLWVARALTEATVTELQRVADCSRQTVHLHRTRLWPEAEVVVRVLGDPRFEALDDGDLRHARWWARYDPDLTGVGPGSTPGVHEPGCSAW